MSSSKTDWQALAQTDVVFGVGASQKLPRLVGDEPTLLVTTSGAVERGTVDQLFKSSSRGNITLFDQIESHYSLADIENSARELAGINYKFIVALGGGSVIDAAKCFSVLLASTEESLRDLIKDGEKLDSISPISVIAVPTTAGSGSEVTTFATVWDYDQQRKLSLASESIIPTAAIVDPTLTLSLPLRETLSSGLDAISHAFESIWNVNATLATIALATESLKLSLSSIKDAGTAPEGLGSRTRMSTASLYAGIAISHTRTALAHSVSYPLTIHIGLDHGFACSIMLPAILKFNAAIDDGRLAKLARDLGQRDIESLWRHLDELLGMLELPQLLGDIDLTFDRLSKLSAEMVTPQRSDNNLRDINFDDLDQILFDTTRMLGRHRSQS